MSHARATTPTDTTRTRILQQALRRGDPQDHLIDQRDRVAERPVPPCGAGPRALPPNEQAALKCLYLTTRSLDPTGKRQGTMGHKGEARPERVRGHVPRPHPNKMITDQIRSTVYPVEAYHRVRRSRSTGFICPWLLSVLRPADSSGPSGLA